MKRPFGIRALLGILLTAVPIAEFFAMGYRLACARTAMSGDYRLPEWKNWKELFLFGLGGRFLELLVALPAATTFYALWLFSKSPITELVNSMGTFKNLLILLVFFLIFASFMGPAMILNYVAEGRFRAAFSLQALKRAATLSYLKGWGLAMFYSLFIFILFYLLMYFIGAAASMTLVYISVPIMVILFFLPGITTWTLLGEAWGKTLY